MLNNNRNKDPLELVPAKRPRANSQENILEINDVDKSTLGNVIPNMSREPLSQYVQHQMSVFNDDTQSE